jgi:hypothetical protein
LWYNSQEEGVRWVTRSGRRPSRYGGYGDPHVKAPPKKTQPPEGTFFAKKIFVKVSNYAHQNLIGTV